MRSFLAFLCVFLSLGLEACLASPLRPTIQGKVVDSDGKPLAHASVLVFMRE